MKKITDITEEQKAKFPEYVEKYIQIGLSTEPADFEAATAAALKAYEICNLEKPMVVLRMSSPMGATLGGAMALSVPSKGGDVESQVRSQIGEQVWSQIESEIESQLESQVWSQIESEIGSQVRSKVDSEVWSKVWSQVESQVMTKVGSQVESHGRTQVRIQVESQIASEVWLKVGTQIESQLWTQLLFQQVRSGAHNYRGGSFWASWGAYISFIRDELGWRDDALDRFEIDESLIKSCGWVWWHENVLAISDRPEYIKRDAEGRLHSENSPSILYRDGWALYHWHGVSIPQEWVEGKPPSAKDALTWENVEQRRAACEIVGWSNVLKQLNAVVIDKDDDEEVGTLLEADIPDSGKERFLQVRCGTGREFVLPVPREMKTALQSNAWTYGFDDVSKFTKPEIRT